MILTLGIVGISNQNLCGGINASFIFSQSSLFVANNKAVNRARRDGDVKDMTAVPGVYIGTRFVDYNKTK